jgi:hypothetical protein
MMKKLATNKDRQANLARKIAKIPDHAQAKDELIDFYTTFQSQKEQQELDPEWAKNNLEYDLRTSDYIVDKCRTDKIYAQNIYAALCNNDFIKNEVMPILLEETWSCSWRYAGGIVADLRGEGDYLDWYCSGIRGDEEVAEFFNTPREHVGEGFVTDEVKEDFFKIGWIVVETDDQQY